MANKERFGDGEDRFFLPFTTISGTTAIPGRVIDLRRYDSSGMQFISTGTVAGTWLVEVSNDYVPTMNGNAYGEIANAGHWSTIPNAQFSPAIATVVSGGSSQPVQANLTFRAMRITFTPTSGAGQVAVLGFAKSWS